MNTMVLYVLITVFALSSIFLSVWILFLKYNAKYTREKYAFCALFTTFSLASLGVTSVLSQSPLVAISKVINKYIGIGFTYSQPSSNIDKFLIIGFIIFVIVMIQSTFKNWGEEITVNQHEQLKNKEKVLFLREGWKQLQRERNNIELPIYKPTDTDYRKHVSALEVPSDSLAWRVQAIELLTLRWHGYYSFEIENDLAWHGKQCCWIGNNIKENKITAVFCERQTPDSKVIKDFTDYVKSLGYKLSKCELIIIVQQGKGEQLHSLEPNIEIKQYSEAFLLDGLVDLKITFYL